MDCLLELCNPSANKNTKVVDKTTNFPARRIGTFWHANAWLQRGLVVGLPLIVSISAFSLHGVRSRHWMPQTTFAKYLARAAAMIAAAVVAPKCCCGRTTTSTTTPR